MTMRPRRRAAVASFTAGFTLVELVLVLTIIGAMAAIVGPRIDLARMRLEAGLRASASTLLAAQRLAVVRQHDVVVLVDPDGRSMQIHEDADNDGEIDPGEALRTVPFGESVVAARADAPPFQGIAADVNLRVVRAGQRGVVFHRNGSASEAGGLYLTSERAAGPDQRPGDTRYLEIQRATGRTGWYRYAGAGWRRGF